MSSCVDPEIAIPCPAGGEVDDCGNCSIDFEGQYGTIFGCYEYCCYDIDWCYGGNWEICNEYTDQGTCDGDTENDCTWAPAIPSIEYLNNIPENYQHCYNENSGGDINGNFDCTG